MSIVIAATLLILIVILLMALTHPTIDAGGGEQGEPGPPGPAGSGGERFVSENDIQTLDENPLTIFTQTLNTNSTYVFDARISATESGGTHRGSYRITQQVYRVAGVAVLGAPGFSWEDETSAPLGAVFGVLGNDAILIVTGLAGETIDWTSTVKWTISPNPPEV